MTYAQQVHDQFLTSRVTVSINTLAKSLSGERKYHAGLKVWEFPDGSALTVQGAGRAHRMTVLDEGFNPAEVLYQDELTSQKKRHREHRT